MSHILGKCLKIVENVSDGIEVDTPLPCHLAPHHGIVQVSSDLLDTLTISIHQRQVPLAPPELLLQVQQHVRDLLVQLPHPVLLPVGQGYEGPHRG